jgi:hypothetical protein
LNNIWTGDCGNDKRTLPYKQAYPKEYHMLGRNISFQQSAFYLLIGLLRLDLYNGVSYLK